MNPFDRPAQRRLIYIFQGLQPVTDNHRTQSGRWKKKQPV
jgi:hypothetical protein